MPDIFDGSTPPVTPPVATFDQLVGEGKKFKDAEALAKGKAEADVYIEQLKRENAGLRSELDPQFDAKAELAKLREEIAASRANPSGTPPRQPVTPEPLTVDGIAAIVNETITRAERNRTAQQNISAANDAVIRAFGTEEAAAAAVKAKAQELGLPLDELKSIAEKSPSAFQKIILGDQQVGEKNAPLNPAVAPVSASVGGAPQPGTKEYFDAILKADRKRYWSPEVQMKLHQAVKAGTYQL